MLPNIAVIVTDSNRKILWVNDDFTIITGYALREVYGQKPSLLQGPKTEYESILRIRKALEDRESIKEEITNYRKNGEIYICKLVIHPIFDDKNNLTNFIAFEVDGDKVKDTDAIPLMQLSKKYESSALKSVEQIRLFNRLKWLMNDQKIYLDPKLTLKTVADKLDTNTKYLSQVVNHMIGINFQQYVNSYRVKEAKSKIEGPEYDNLTLYGLALQCGFKNKSTFYKVFKTVAGTTPKAYRLQILEDNGDKEA